MPMTYSLFLPNILIFGVVKTVPDAPTYNVRVYRYSWDKLIDSRQVLFSRTFFTFPSLSVKYHIVAKSCSSRLVWDESTDSTSSFTVMLNGRKVRLRCA